MHKFGFDGFKLDGCGAQTNMQLWDDVFKADGGSPVMVENCHWGRKVHYEPRDAVPTTTCLALLLPAAAGGRRVTNESCTMRTWFHSSAVARPDEGLYDICCRNLDIEHPIYSNLNRSLAPVAGTARTCRSWWER